MDEPEGRRRLLEALFDHAPDVVVVTDADGRIAEVNARVERIFGYTPAELQREFMEREMKPSFRHARIHTSRGHFLHPTTATAVGPSC